MSTDFYMFQDMLNNQKSEEGVIALFYDKMVKTNEINDKGFPVFTTKTYVKIRIRDNSDIYEQPAKDNDIKRFPTEYNRYLLEKKELDKGTPLSQFAFINVEQLEHCKMRGVFTIERLSELTEEQARELDLEKEKELAVKFLDVSKNNKTLDDFSKKEKKYKAEIKKLTAEIERLKALVNE